MKSRLVVISLVTVLGVMGWLLWQPREPVWQGKPLSEWMRGLEGPGATRESYSESADAIRRMGTNTLPIVLTMFRSQDSPIKQRAMVLIPERWRRGLHFTPAPLQRRRALFALDALGRTASPAVPELIGLLNAKEVEIRSFSAQALGSLGAEEYIVVPALTNALSDKDVGVRRSIEENLGRIGKESHVAIPALVSRLGCTNVAEFEEVCLALSKFGPQARAAVPTLSELSKNPSQPISGAASNALKHILQDRPIAR